METSLYFAHASWLPALDRGIVLLEAGDAQAAIQPLSEAVTQSARFHPIYHFCESAQHTERGTLRLSQGNWESALADFTRAIFLDHTNQTAIAGKKLAEAQRAAPLPIYDRMPDKLENWPISFSSHEGENIYALITQARAAADESLYSQCITLTDITHKHYHKLAALPWLWRSRAFSALEEKELSRNDARRAADLDRHNEEVKEALTA